MIRATAPTSIPLPDRRGRTSGLRRPAAVTARWPQW